MFYSYLLRNKKGLEHTGNRKLVTAETFLPLPPRLAEKTEMWWTDKILPVDFVWVSEI